MRRHLGERGASSVEAVLLLPATLLAFLAIAHGAIILHAGDVAQSAALAAYESARLADSADGEGERAGMGIIEAAGGSLQDASVTVSRESGVLHVRVTGTAGTLLPWRAGISRHVHGPAERWSE